MKKRAFFVFDEHTDYVKECIKIGMKPIKGHTYVEEFVYSGTKYKTLSMNDCYSGWTITIMALPKPTYIELIRIVLKSNCYDEFVGGLGILLKEYPQEFKRFLEKSSNKNKRIRKIKKTILNEISIRIPQVLVMSDLLLICSQ